MTALQVNIGRRFLVKRGKSGRQRPSLLRQNIGNDTPTGVSDPELMHLPSSKSRTVLRRPIENDQVKLDERSREILRVRKRRVATKDVQ